MDYDTSWQNEQHENEGQFKSFKNDYDNACCIKREDVEFVLKSVSESHCDYCLLWEGYKIECSDSSKNTELDILHIKECAEYGEIPKCLWNEIEVREAFIYNVENTADSEGFSIHRDEDISEGEYYGL